MDPVRSRAVLLMIVLTAFITTLDNTVLNVALPSIQRDLGLSLAGLEWIVTGYLLSFSSLLLVGGRLTDLLGRRRVLVTGLALFTLASGLAGLAGGAPALIAARALQGAGAALAIPAALAVVVGDLPSARKAVAVGLWTSALATALALGPLIGGVIAEHWGWNWIFLLHLPPGVLAVLLALAVPARAPGASPLLDLSLSPRHAALPRRFTVPPMLRALDIPGVLLSATTLLCLTYALVEGAATAFTSRYALACLAGALAAAVTLAAVERHARAPMIDLTLFRGRPFSGGTAAQVLWGMGINGVFFFTPLFLQRVLGYSPAGAGLALLPLAGMLIATSRPAARLAAVLGAPRVVTAGLVLVAAGLLVTSLSGRGTSYWELQPGLLLIGAGSALTVSLTTASLADVRADRSGMAAGVVSTAREVSGILGVVFIGVIVTHGERVGLREGLSRDTAFVQGYASGLRLAAFLVLCAAVVTATTLRRENGGPALVHDAVERLDSRV